ncbi:MAG TPA: (2Fe-2S)-binding protein [Gemmatimonadaceae bacterium]|nr:(2Fe-2S)-binding protein [Gemmatimonadaceae bacterium]
MSHPVSIDAPVRDTVHATFVVNGERREIAFAPHKTLLEVLREDLALTGTKHGCELGECGTCTVLVDGVPVLSCLALALAYRDRAIETVEGMAAGNTLHPLQDAFAELGAAQCGYCTPGFLLTAKALLDANPNPTRAEIVDALSGNLCRCTGYLKIFEAVERARDAGCGMRDAKSGTAERREARGGDRDTTGDNRDAHAGARDPVATNASGRRRNGGKRS